MSLCSVYTQCAVRIRVGFWQHFTTSLFKIFIPYVDILLVAVFVDSKHCLIFWMCIRVCISWSCLMSVSSVLRFFEVAVSCCLLLSFAMICFASDLFHIRISSHRMLFRVYSSFCTLLLALLLGNLCPFIPYLLSCLFFKHTRGCLDTIRHSHVSCFATNMVRFRVRCLIITKLVFCVVLIVVVVVVVVVSFHIVSIVRPLVSPHSLYSPTRVVLFPFESSCKSQASRCCFATAPALLLSSPIRS